MTAQGIGPREAERRTGIAASDFSRIRNARLERFTIDRLMSILDRLGQEVHFRLMCVRVMWVGRRRFRRIWLKDGAAECATGFDNKDNGGAGLNKV